MCDTTSWPKINFENSAIAEEAERIITERTQSRQARAKPQIPVGTFLRVGNQLRFSEEKYKATYKIVNPAFMREPYAKRFSY